MNPDPPRPPPVKANKTKGKTSSRGRFECINAFLDVTLADLERTELAVWLLLWRDTKPDGSARTSQTDLARRAGCNPRKIRRALVNLERTGLVRVVRGVDRQRAVGLSCLPGRKRGPKRKVTEGVGVRLSD